MKKRKKFIWIILFLIIVLIVWSRRGKQDGVEVNVSEVSLQNIREMVSSSGKIQPEVEVKISSDVSGEITELFVKEGDTVAQGQILCRINPELYESALAQMRASLNNSKASLATSEAQAKRAKANLVQQTQAFERQKKMYENRVVSSQEFENAEAAYLMAEAEYHSAEKSVLAAKYAVESAAYRLEESARNYGRTSIYAPIKGVVTSMSVEKGERVVGTSQMAGTEMMRIALLDLMEIRVEVNENDIIRINQGDSAWVEVDAYRRMRFKGRVSHVARSVKSKDLSSSQQQAANYEVKVRILPESYQSLMNERESQPFWPGMTGAVDIITQIEEQVLAVPLSSVIMAETHLIDSLLAPSREGVDRVEAVFVLNSDQTVSLKQVITGIQDGTFIRIVEGLQLGEQVVTGPYGVITQQLEPGMKVRIQE